MPKSFVDAECSDCNATGIYHGFCEPKGIGVVCLRCKGTGNVRIEYVPFVARKRRNDIKFVQRSRGNFIVTGLGPTGQKITYDDFWNGKMP